MDVKGKKLMEESDCMACHGIDTKINGPSLREISNKYDIEDASMLVGKG